MGGGGKTQTTIENKDPWGPAQPYLKDAFEETKNIYDQNKANFQAFDGDIYASMRPEQIDALKGTLKYATGAGADAANLSAQGGANLLGQGINGLTNSTNALTSLFNTNSPEKNLAAATAYANNPAVDGMVDSAMSSYRRDANENLRPELQRQSALAGNTNSTRSMIRDANIDRSLGEQAANIRSNLQGQLFQTGLQNAQADETRRLAAAQALGSNANSALASGFGGLAQGTDMMSKMNEAAINAGTMLTANDQTGLDNALAKYQLGQTQTWDNINNAYNIWANGGTQGGTTTSISKIKEQPSALSTAGSMLGLASGLFKLCDERLKENIVELHTMANGVKLYSFNYRGSDEVVIGPIAQQVARIKPKAVKSFDGTLAVKMSEMWG